MENFDQDIFYAFNSLTNHETKEDSENRKSKNSNHSALLNSSDRIKLLENMIIFWIIYLLIRFKTKDQLEKQFKPQREKNISTQEMMSAKSKHSASDQRLSKEDVLNAIRALEQKLMEGRRQEETKSQSVSEDRASRPRRRQQAGQEHDYVDEVKQE